MALDFPAQDFCFAVDILVFTVRDGQLCVMLSRRKKAPFSGKWALPGRLVGIGDSAEGAADALMNEMLPAADAYMEQLYTFSRVNRDPRGRVISVAFLAAVPWSRLKEAQAGARLPFACFRSALGGNGLRLENDAGAVLTAGDPAFDHGDIIAMGIRRLRGKIDYSDIAFAFLEDVVPLGGDDLRDSCEQVVHG